MKKTNSLANFDHFSIEICVLKELLCANREKLLRDFGAT